MVSRLVSPEKTNAKKRRSSKGSYTNYRFVGSSTIVWTCQALVCGLLKDSRTFFTVWFPRKFPNYFPILYSSLFFFFFYIRDRRISQWRIATLLWLKNDRSSGNYRKNNSEKEDSFCKILASLCNIYEYNLKIKIRFKYLIIITYYKLCFFIN